MEWNETEGAVKRTYLGLIKKKTVGVTQFDTTQNHFLAVGEDGQIKFWEMDNVNLLTSTDAGGGLSVSAMKSDLTFSSLLMVTLLKIHKYVSDFMY